MRNKYIESEMLRANNYQKKIGAVEVVNVCVETTKYNAVKGLIKK